MHSFTNPCVRRGIFNMMLPAKEYMASFLATLSSTEVQVATICSRHSDRAMKERAEESRKNDEMPRFRFAPLGMTIFYKDNQK